MLRKQNGLKHSVCYQIGQPSTQLEDLQPAVIYASATLPVQV